jgi:hypothetical protein
MPPCFTRDVAQGGRSKREGGVFPWWFQLLAIDVTLLLVLIIGVGFSKQWGAPQWGPLAEWFAVILTFAAVLVAVLAAIIAQREAAEGRRDRLVDHELQRRRENLQALDRTWAGIATMALVFPAFTDYLQNLPARFDPNVPRTDKVPPDRPANPLAYDIGERVTVFMDTWVKTIEPPLFLTLALLRDTPMEKPVKELNDKLTKLKEEGFPQLTHPAFFENRRPDVEPVDAMRKDITRLRNEHLNLATKHFSLALDDVERWLSKGRGS